MIEEKIGMKDLMELFIDKIITEKNLSKATIYAYNNDLEQFKKFLFKLSKNLFYCDEEVFLTWNKFLIEKKYSPNSRIRKISVINQFMKFLFLEKYIKKNISKKIMSPLQEKLLPKLISKDEIFLILKYLKKNSKKFSQFQTLVITELLYATGMRISELVSLKKLAVKEDLSNIVVLGKGMKERQVPLGDEPKALLKLYIKKIDNDESIKIKNKAGWLFPSRKSHLTRQAYYYNLKKAAKEADVEDSLISPHTLRHAFASHMLSNGADLKVIQYFLGHEDISTVQIYTHINSKESLEAIKKHPLANIVTEN